MKKNVPKSIATLCLISITFFQSPTLHAQTTAFTYQGQLIDGGNLASGRYDLRFSIFDSLIAGIQQGTTLTNTATLVSNGLFTVMLDFTNQFPGADRWLEIGVRTNGGSAFNILAPRQPITPAPYAITAMNAATSASVSGNIPVSQVTGTIPFAQLPSGIVTNGAGNVSLTGTFNGNGAGLTNLTPQLNQYIAESTSSTTIISTTTDTDIPGMSLTPPAGTYLVWLTGSVSTSSSSQYANISIYSGATQVASSVRKISTSTSSVSSAFACTAVVNVDGATAIKGRWSLTSTITATMVQRSLLILRVN